MCLAVVAVGCGGPTQVGKKPSWRSGASGERPAESSAPQVVVFAPSGAAVTRYNDRAPAPPDDDPLAAAVVNAIRDAAVEAGMPAPAIDGRLYAAARDLAAVVPEDAPMKYPAVEFALQRHGIIEPSPHLMVIWGPIDDPQAIMEQLAGRIPEILQSGPFARIGFASATRGGNGEGAAILALQASYIQTEPIPRALPGGGDAQIRGRIAAPFEKPEAFITRESGEVEEVPLTKSAGGAFALTFRCNGRRGRQQVEITAVDATGSTVLANFPIWCGQQPPTSITLEYDPDDEVVLSAEAAEARLVELVNRDRARYKLPPLEHDPRVSAVARAHSREMYETGVVAHISPRTGSASDRVRAAAIKTPVVLENVARAYGVGEAEEGLMNSPGHRANILSPDATHVGIGVVVGEEVAGRRELFITQVFTYRAFKVDAAEVARELRSKIAAAAKVSHEAELSKLAQMQADELASGVSRAEANKRTSFRARNIASRYAKIRTATVALPRAGAFDAASVFTGSAPVSHYGIGVAQGPHPELGEHALHVVLLLGFKQ